MSNQDWLSLTEIARLWSEETGESAEALERDLQAWFSEFVAGRPSQQPGLPGHNPDTTILLMDLLGGQHLQRGSFAVYCEERGHAKPRFWFTGGADDREPSSPPSSDSPSDTTFQAPTGYALEAGPTQSQYAEVLADQEDHHFEPAQPAPETGHEVSCPASDHSASSEPAATPEPADLNEVWPGPSTVWQVASGTAQKATARLLAWVRTLLPRGGGLFGNKATWLAGGLTLALSLLVAGFLLGQALTGRPETGPDVAGRDQLPATVVSVLRSELAEARRLHSAALDTAGAGVETARQELVLAAQAASAHAALLGRDLDAAQLRIADLEAEARTAKAKAGGLAEQLVEIRKAHATALEKVRAEAGTRRLEPLPVAETAAEKAATRKQELDKALGRIVQLEATLQWERLAKEMEQARQAQDVSHRNAPMPAAVSSKQATSTPDNPDVASGQSSLLRQAHNNFITLYHQGRYAEAEPYAREAVRLRTQEFGPNDPTTAASINNLAVIYQAQGRYAEAEPLYQRSLAIKEKILGSEHPDVARSLNNLAALYHARGHYMQAETLYQRSLAIREKALEPEHPEVAPSLGNLAELYRAQGRYAEAEPLLHRAIKINEKALGPDHPALATDFNYLALIYKAQGRYTEAEPLYQRSLAIREKALEPEHPDVAKSLNNLAGLYNAQGRYIEAERLYERSLTVLEEALGPEHPHVATSLENYAGLLRDTARAEEAERMEARAKEIRAKHAQENPVE